MDHIARLVARWACGQEEESVEVEVEDEIGEPFQDGEEGTGSSRRRSKQQVSSTAGDVGQETNLHRIIFMELMNLWEITDKLDKNDDSSHPTRSGSSQPRSTHMARLLDFRRPRIRGDMAIRQVGDPQTERQLGPNNFTDSSENTQNLATLSFLAPVSSSTESSHKNHVNASTETLFAS